MVVAFAGIVDVAVTAGALDGVAVALTKPPVSEAVVVPPQPASATNATSDANSALRDTSVVESEHARVDKLVMEISLPFDSFRLFVR